LPCFGRLWHEEDNRLKRFEDYSVVFHNTDPRLYVDGPGLARFDDGTLLAVVPVLPHSKALKNGEAQLIGDSTVYVLSSGNGGTTWEGLSKLPYYSAAPWVHNETLYLFAFEPGSGHRNDDMHLLRSDDGGCTWSSPSVLFKGHYWNVQTGMVVRNNRLYWAVDDIAEGLHNEGRTQRVIAGDLSTDPMAPKAWRMSNADDLVLIARSNLGRDDAHDADHATFHRARRFRSLALPLHPDHAGD